MSSMHYVSNKNSVNLRIFLFSVRPTIICCKTIQLTKNDRYSISNIIIYFSKNKRKTFILQSKVKHLH